MRITVGEFREYAEANTNRVCHTTRDAAFSFDLLRSAKPAIGSPYTIRFKSPSWSASTVRRCGPADVVRFLAEFSAHNERPVSEYRNRAGQ